MEIIYQCLVLKLRKNESNNVVQSSVTFVKTKESELKDRLIKRISQIIKIEIKSSLRRLIIVRGYAMRYINNILLKIRKSTEGLIVDETLTLLDAAKYLWIKDAQLSA